MQPNNVERRKASSFGQEECAPREIVVVCLIVGVPTVLSILWVTLERGFLYLLELQTTEYFKRLTLRQRGRRPHATHILS